MFDELFEQESYFDRIDEMRTYPNTERLDWTWARSRVNELLAAIGEIEAKNTKPPKRHLESYESGLLAELDSLLSLCWFPSDLEKDQQAIKELMLKAMFLGSELKAGTLKLSAAKGVRFTGNKRGLSPLYALVLDFLLEHGRDTPAKVLCKLLMQHQGGGVIDEITDDENGGKIFIRGKSEPTTFKAFLNGVSKTKKRIPSRD